MDKIFARERRKVEKGEKKPRYRVVAVSGKGLKMKADHFRKRELEEIAKQCSYEVVYLPRDGSGAEGQRKD